MNPALIAAVGLFALTACQPSAAPTAPAPTPKTDAAPHSGVIKAHFDTAVPLEADFYRHVNGTWLRETPIPADKSNHGAFSVLSDRAEEQVHTLIQNLVAAKPAAGSEDQKIADLYRSFLATEAIEKAGAAPLQPLLQQIDALEGMDGLPALLADFSRQGVPQPFGFGINQDAKDATVHIPYFSQFGQLGLPDRSFYLDDSERFQSIRAAYVDYMKTMLGLIGVKDAAAEAEALLALETKVAEAHWTRVDARDRDKTYNRYAIKTLNTLTPGLDLAAYARAAGITVDDVIVMQPEAITAMATALGEAPFSRVQNLLKLRVAGGFARYLSDDFVNAQFAFYGKTLSGIAELEPRWKRAVATVEGAMGEALGKRYVAAHFPPEAKARMETMVDYLIQAYAQSIKELDWMTAATKEQALEKLSKFTPKIGYPSEWRDYSALTIKADDLVGNILRSNVVDQARELARQGQPVDRNEWFMTPQTVNAYYNPGMNEIVFPAAILQPPFFDLNADDAVNYGGIGAVIGHEIGHGFDDQGSKYDGDGNLKSWWTEEDRKAFEDRTKKLIGQYDQFCPLEGHCVNGALAIGENIGDLGGLSIALKAYRLALAGETPPVLDGYTGEQRFFIGWAQIWARNYREEELIARLRTGPHAPNEYRANGIVRNLPDWYAAFDVGPDAPMFLPEDERVRIW
jgi:putative endopeptidase